MFRKILIANRGEIACRVIRTARRMGIATVAVYSEADVDSRHVREADEAVSIGPAAAAESYLNDDAIIRAVRETGADAVHPGYGFLSENAAFAEAVQRANVVFIGPPSSAIAAMGDKIESKRLAKKVGVSVIPGGTDAIPTAQAAREAADQIGYPVMIKASAGGGGKGMRIAYRGEDVAEAFRLAQSEARSSFGDDRILIEKFIENPRHIEIQIIGDSAGQVLYLGERECSIQRRHQKIIEEAPSPLLSPETRQKMGAQAVALAKAVGYHSVGTVEFVADQNQNFYFLEMNTRLQVEHPVTEMITDLDLVEWMIRIAAGEILPFAQQDIVLKGNAIEARIYAEDPTRHFLPSTGRIRYYKEPDQGTAADGAVVRLDSGVFEGGEVSIHYDPMMAKLVAHAPDRQQAAMALRQALDQFLIKGPTHNIPFLAAVLKHADFLNGQISTHFIGHHYPGGFNATLPVADRFKFAAVAGVIYLLATEHGLLPGSPQPSEHRNLLVRLDDDEILVEIWGRQKAFSIQIGEDRHMLETDWRPGQALVAIRLDDQPFVFQLELHELAYRLYHDGASTMARVWPSSIGALVKFMRPKTQVDRSGHVLSPMPGRLISISVAAGDEVKIGQELAVVEAMKMENVLKAERSGVIAKLHARSGDNVMVDQPILEFE